MGVSISVTMLCIAFIWNHFRLVKIENKIEQIADTLDEVEGFLDEIYEEREK